MSPSKSKCLNANNCVQFIKCAVPLEPIEGSTEKVNKVEFWRKKLDGNSNIKDKTSLHW